jgi:hypothetical protein
VRIYYKLVNLEGTGGLMIIKFSTCPIDFIPVLAFWGKIGRKVFFGKALPSH